MPKYRKILVYGTGLIGGSFALSMRKAAKEIIGYSRRPASMETAMKLGLVDRAGINPAHDLPDADLVLIATPVGQMPKVFEQISHHLGPDTLITDAGSTKQDVIQAARINLGDKIANFVPAHPIAGAEYNGPASARDDLFAGKKVVLTPLPENDDATLDRVKHAWALCGAEIHELTPERHDAIFAAVSHLPHLLSYGLVHDLVNRSETESYFNYAASGFRDFTRIAASHPEMWRDICLANRMALSEELARYQSVLDQLAGALADNDGERLQEIFASAQTARRSWQKEKERIEEQPETNADADADADADKKKKHKPDRKHSK